MSVIIWRRKRTMKRNWKRNTLVFTLLVLVGAAAFLNWKYAPGADAETGTKILGQSTLVSGGAGSAAVSAGDGAAGSAAGDAEVPDEESVYTGSDYFASARLTRQQARDNAISMLEEAARQDDAQQSVLDEASQGIQVLANYTMTESQIENLVTAKGYADCVAFMGKDSLSVVVGTDSGELTQEDVAKVTDIAMTETGYPADSIKIVAAK
jgi:stage III sporulation protein AH